MQTHIARRAATTSLPSTPRTSSMVARRALPARLARRPSPISKTTEEGTHIVDQRLRLFECGVVTALWHHGPAREVVARLDPLARRDRNLFREQRARGRHRHARGVRRGHAVFIVDASGG